MFPRAGVVISIGSGSARILKVTEQLMEYTDEAGRAGVIQFADCARNFAWFCRQHQSQFMLLGDATQEDADRENERCVGLRSTRSLQLMDEQATRFEFQSWEALMRLVGQLFKVGLGHV